MIQDFKLDSHPQRSRGVQYIMTAINPSSLGAGIEESRSVLRAKNVYDFRREQTYEVL
jgi:hypothetical protein